MKNIISIFAMLLTLTSAHALAQTTTAACDLQKAEDDVDVAKKAMRQALENAIAQDDMANLNMSTYIDKVDTLRACEKIVTPKSVSSCDNHSIWANKALSSKFSMLRLFQLNQGRRGCLQSLTYQHIILNERKEQILYYQNGFYTMTHVIPARTAKGIVTGRTYLFADGELTGKSHAYVVDFPEPLDSYDLSYFWGLNVPVGDGLQKLAYSISGNNITFEWANGAYVTVDSLTEDIVDSNFFAPISYQGPVVLTDEDKDPASGRMRLFPKVELLSGAEKIVGTPFLNH